MKIVGVAALRMPSMPEKQALRIAAAAAYGVTPRDVHVGNSWGEGESYPAGHRVYLNLWGDSYDGDLHVAFEQDVDEALVANFDARVQRLAELLGMMIVTDDSDEENPIIHLPDGTTVRRALEELPEGGLLLPDDLKAIAAAERPARAA